MKKLLFLTLWTAMSCCAVTAHTFSAVNADGDTIYYNITSNTGTLTVSVTSCFNDSNAYTGAVSIPSSVTYLGNTYAVTSIGDLAFYHSSLTSVTIPSSVTSIEDNAFENCIGLASVSIPSSVTSIGYQAFYLVRNILYHGSATGSPWGALCVNGVEDGDLIFSDSTRTHLSGCRTSATSVTIPSSVTFIGIAAFRDCNSLASVTIPSSVTTISFFAFQNCSSLASVTIPSSVTTIGTSTFQNCSSLASVTLPASVVSIGQAAFSGCSSLASVTIPSAVGLIGSYSFERCSSLTSVSVPSSVYTIGSYAFRGCSSLVSVSIPSSVTRIGEAAFFGCSSLASVTIPSSVTAIDYYVFSGCSSLASVSIPSSVFYIGNEAFKNCSSLTSVAIPSSVTSICAGAFHNCSSLASVTIPSAVTVLSYNVFDGCSSLASITIPSSVTSIGNEAFRNCSSLVSVTIPPAVTYIGNEAFGGCSSLAAVAWNARSVTGYPSSDPSSDSFHGCTSLSRVTFGDSVLSIPNHVFYGRSSITLLTIGAGTTSIGAAAFSGCWAIDTMRVRAEVPPSISGTTFAEVRNSVPVFVPCDAVNDYQTDASWSRFIRIHKDESCPVRVTASANNTAWGTVTGCGDFAIGDTCTLTATANEGFVFLYWNDDNTENPRQIIVRGEASYIAYFTRAGSVESPEVRDVALYPNPTTGLLHLSSPEVQRVEIYDGQGHDMGSYGPTGCLDLSALAAGSYTLRITLPQGVAVRKVVKK